MPTDDERNVDEQLDQAQRKEDDAQKHTLIHNHRNNTRTDAEEIASIAGASGAVAGTTTVTDPATAQGTNEEGRP